jgi:hypothetical protein
LKKERETSREYEYWGDPAFLKTPVTKEEKGERKKGPKVKHQTKRVT